MPEAAIHEHGNFFAPEKYICLSLQGRQWLAIHGILYSEGVKRCS